MPKERDLGFGFHFLCACWSAWLLLHFEMLALLDWDVLIYLVLERSYYCVTSPQVNAFVVVKLRTKTLYGSYLVVWNWSQERRECTMFAIDLGNLTKIFGTLWVCTVKIERRYNKSSLALLSPIKNLTDGNTINSNQE